MAIDNREFHRGEVWYVKADNSTLFEGELGIGRPMLIMSSEKGCKTSAEVAGIWCSSSSTRSKLPINVELIGMRRQTWALCSKPVVMSKLRLEQKMYIVPKEIMETVDLRFMEAMGLPANPGTPADQKYIEDLEIERDYYRRLYERMLDEKCGQRIKEDISARQAVGPLDLNTCSAAELRAKGVPQNVIDPIIAGRPYEKLDDIDAAKGLTSIQRDIIKKIGYVSEPESSPKLPNLNEATAEEIRAASGIWMSVAENIVAYREKNGPYKEIGDLVRVPRCGKIAIDKLKGKVVL